MTEVPLWVEAIVAVLLVASGIFVVISAIGFLTLREFFARMHPPAIAYTFGSWTMTLASVVYFSAVEARPVVHFLLIPVLLALTVPVTTVLLSRTALFRRRGVGDAETPPPLG